MTEWAEPGRLDPSPDRARGGGRGAATHSVQHGTGHHLRHRSRHRERCRLPRLVAAGLAGALAVLGSATAVGAAPARATGGTTSGGTGAARAAARRPGAPRAPFDPLAVDRYFASLRAGYGPPQLAASRYLAAQRHAQTLRARPGTAQARSGLPAWTSLGPAPITGGFGGATSGRVTSLALVPGGAAAGEIVLGSAGGGVWTSTNQGQSWSTTTTNLPTGLAIGAVAVDPTNPSLVLAGTGEDNACGDCFYGAGLLSSSNDGASWSVVNPGGVFTGLEFSSLAFDPHNGNDVWAGTSQGLFQSTDAGAQWSQADASVAGGANVTDVVTVATSATQTAVYAAVAGVGVVESTDAGAHWTTLGGGLPGAASFLGAALAAGTDSAAYPQAASTLYAAVDTPPGFNPNGGQISVYTSTDGGTSWSELGAAPAYSNASYAYGPGQGNSDQSTYDNTLAVDPANPAVVVAAGITAVESTDGGASWTNLDDNNQAFFAPGASPTFHPDLHALVFTPGGALDLGTDGGLWQLSAAGVAAPQSSAGDFTDLNTAGLNITQYYRGVSEANDGAVILAGAQDVSSTLYTGGAAWQSVDGGDGGWSYVNPADTSEQLAEADKTLQITTDSWQRTGTGTDITPPGNNLSDTSFVPPLAVLASSSTPSSPTVFYGGQDLWVTQDPTAATPSWTQLTTTGSAHTTSANPDWVSYLASAPGNPAVLYVGFSQGQLLVSTNATSATPTFTDVTPASVEPARASYVTGIAVNPSNPGDIALTFSDTQVQSSPVPPAVVSEEVSLPSTGTPSVTSATNVTTNLPAGVATDAVAYDQGQAVVADDVGVFATAWPATPSSSWTALGTGLPNVQVLGLTVTSSGKILAATFGRGLWELAPSAGSTAPASGFVPEVPVRILDTRSSSPLVPGAPLTVQVAGQAGVPSNASAVAVNVTAISPSGDGNLRVYPAGAATPPVSTINYLPGSSVANYDMVGLSGGRIQLQTFGSPVNVTVDVTGYVTGSSTSSSPVYTPLASPQRVLDTRPGSGATQADPGPLAAGTAYPVQVTGVDGIPSAATSVAVNVTAVSPPDAGNLRVFPAGTAAPDASTINYVPGQTTADFDVVKPVNGMIDVQTFGSPVNVTVDVVGYSTSGLTTQTPVRAVDTRPGSQIGPVSGPVSPGTVESVTLAGTAGVPATAAAVLVNVTAVQPGGNGNLRVYPDSAGTGATAEPGSSTINYIPGQTSANFVVVELPADGKVDFESNGSAVNVLFDVVGYLPAGT